MGGSRTGNGERLGIATIIVVGPKPSRAAVSYALQRRIRVERDRLTLSGSELREEQIDERLAAGLIGLAYREIVLVKVTLRPEAKTVLGWVYDSSVDGDVQRFRMKTTVQK